MRNKVPTITFNQKLQKLKRVIESCETQEQLDNSTNYVYLYIRKLGLKHYTPLFNAVIDLGSAHAKNRSLVTPSLYIYDDDDDEWGC